MISYETDFTCLNSLSYRRVGAIIGNLNGTCSLVRNQTQSVNICTICFHTLLIFAFRFQRHHIFFTTNRQPSNAVDISSEAVSIYNCYTAEHASLIAAHVLVYMVQLKRDMPLDRQSLHIFAIL